MFLKFVSEKTMKNDLPPAKKRQKSGIKMAANDFCSYFVQLLFIKCNESNTNFLIDNIWKVYV